MATDFKMSFPATTDGMIAALEAAEHYGVALNLAGELVSRVRIVVEELFTNTIKYGYGEECARPVRLHLSADPLLTLTYEDEAPPFNPTAWKAEDDGLPPDERPEGKAGIKMVLALSTTATYRPRPDGNCLVLSFAPRTADGTIMSTLLGTD